MTRSIRQIIITGDILATRASEQVSNLRWLADLLRAPIEAAGLPVDVGLEFDRNAVLAAVGLGSARDARHCWIEADAFDDAALAMVRAAVPEGALVVGYEMLAGTREVLSRAGVPWVDIWLHPVRFCDDILMSFAASEPEVTSRLAGFGVDPESIRAQARLLKVQNYRGFNRPAAALPERSLLVVGQTPVDKSILGPRGFGTLGEYEAELEALMRDHVQCYFAPHPKAARLEPTIARLVAAKRLTIARDPAYLLLADPGVAHVAALSSSLVEEARYFGKETTWLMEPPVDWQSVTAVFQDFAFPHFWAEILADVAETVPHTRAGYLSPKNKLRDALSFDWGYPAVDRDRFAAVEMGEEAEAGFAEKLAAAEVVSFDVFDTLITRDVADPRDIFNQLGMRQDRLDAFAVAHKAASADGRDEPRLAEIYAQLGGADPEAEIAAELAAVRVRPSGRALYEAAKSSGKRVILVSDMYLDAKQVAALLHKVGYDGWDALYVSSELGAAKRTGRLWDHVLSVEGPGLFHVGDNPIGDVAQAEKRGIVTHLLPTARVNFAESRPWALDATKRLGGHSRLLATLQNELADAGPVVWDAERFGRYVLGPLLVGFAQWLEGSEKLHFLTREGDVMRAVYEALGEETPAAGLYASRALVAPLAVQDRASMLAVLEGGLQEEPLGAFFARQYGVDVLEPAKVEAAGFASALELIGPRTDREALRRLALSQEAEILAGAAAKRTEVKAYLEAQGVGAESCLVDIGYHGTVQRAYSALLGVPLSGAYMGLFDTGSDLESARGWLFEGKRKNDEGEPLCKHRAIWEVLLCAADGSVIGLGSDGGALRSEARDVKRQGFVRAAHKGAVAFAQDWAAAGNEAIPAEAGQAMLAAVLEHPSEGLAHLLKDLEFEDAFAGGGLQALIGTSPEKSLWKEGAKVLAGGGDGFARNARGARRPKWEAWGPYGVLGWRHLLPVAVGPVIGRIGESHDVDHYKEDPIGFFRGLSNARFRQIGRVLYPWD